MMALREIHSWTLGGLVGAFIDLVIAYFLLCGSAIGFFASKFLMFFGLFLPCPCKGVLGYKNSNLCLHKMLFDWPLRKICSVQVMAVKRFPYDLVRVKDHSCTLNEKVHAQNNKCENRVLELEDEASCSYSSSPRLPASGDRENGYDAKGKGTMRMKRRSGIRHRRKGNNEYGKFSSVFSSENCRLDVTPVPCLRDESDVAEGKTSETMNPSATGKEVSLLDDKDAQTDGDMDESAGHSFEFGGLLVNSPQQDKYSSSVEIHISNRQDNMQIVGSEEDRIKMLEEALEAEKTAYVALCIELEKERAAAATAADEAMAMISRLQEEKASIEFETRQYQRMIEERDAYEEEEMSILQEILIRRERENHFLEKELEAYRQMSLRGFEQSNEQSLETLEHHQLQTDSAISIVNKPEIVNIHSNDTVDQGCIRIDSGEALKKNGILKNDNLHSSFRDTEPDVLDVHVVDDNIKLRKEENGMIKGFPFNTSHIPRDGGLALRNLQVLSSGSVSNFSRTCMAGSENGVVGNINEKLKIGNEIEMLGERLKMLKHEKEKLTFFAENEESEKVQMKLLEEIANHLREIKQLRHPARGSSLPPSSAKANLKGRRSQSETWKTCESS